MSIINLPIDEWKGFYGSHRNETSEEESQSNIIPLFLETLINLILVLLAVGAVAQTGKVTLRLRRAHT